MWPEYTYRSQTADDISVVPYFPYLLCWWHLEPEDLGFMSHKYDKCITLQCVLTPQATQTLRVQTNTRALTATVTLINNKDNTDWLNSWGLEVLLKSATVLPPGVLSSEKSATNVTCCWEIQVHSSFITGANSSWNIFFVCSVIYNKKHN